MIRKLFLYFIAAEVIIFLPLSEVNSQSRQPVWSEVKLPPPAFANEVERARSLIHDSKFYDAWRFSPADGLGHFTRALVATNPNCKPGNVIAGYRSVSSLLLELDDPARATSVDLESARKMLAVLNRDEVSSLKNNLSQTLRARLDPVELSIVEWSVDGSRSDDPYPCYETDPPPVGTSINRPNPVRLDATLQPYVCYDISRRFQEEKASPPRTMTQRPDTFFRRTRMIRVAFPGISVSLKKQLLRIVLNSMRLWYLACSNCSPDNSAVLAVDDRYWIIDSFVRALEGAADLSEAAPQIPKAGTPVGTTLNELLDAKRIGDLFGSQFAERQKS